MKKKKNTELFDFGVTIIALRVKTSKASMFGVAVLLKHGHETGRIKVESKNYQLSLWKCNLQVLIDNEN